MSLASWKSWLPGLSRMATAGHRSTPFLQTLHILKQRHFFYGVPRFKVQMRGGICVLLRKLNLSVYRR